MYAFISNECKLIVKSQHQLEFLTSVFSYPKFAKVSTEAEARQFFIENDRAFFTADRKLYGRKDSVGYVKISYFIRDNNIYVNADTSAFGYIKFRDLPDNVIAEYGYEKMRLKFKNVILDDNLIAHHCIAITNILRLFGPYVSIDIKVPDISVFLALTKYTGNNYLIKTTQNLIISRSGYVSYTIPK